MSAVVLDARPVPTADAQRVAGLDLGLARDASALVVIEKSDDGERSRVLHCEAWTPRAGQRVSIEAIEQHILDLHKRQPIELLAFDPWQASYLAERLQKVGITTAPVPFTAKNLQSMATAVIESFSEHRIELYDEPALLADLRSLRVIEKSFGYRLDANRNAAGHADRAIALAIALHAAKELPPVCNAMDRFGEAMEAFSRGEVIPVPSLRELLGPEVYDRYVTDDDDGFPAPTGGRIRFGAGW